MNDITFITTLAGYIHWQLTGEKVLGIGDASGMLPIDPETKNYDKMMLRKFRDTIAHYNFPWDIEEILPRVLMAGEKAGTLTDEGAHRIDRQGICVPVYLYVRQKAMPVPA